MLIKINEQAIKMKDLGHTLFCLSVVGVQLFDLVEVSCCGKWPFYLMRGKACQNDL